MREDAYQCVNCHELPRLTTSLGLVYEQLTRSQLPATWPRLVTSRISSQTLRVNAQTHRVRLHNMRKLVLSVRKLIVPVTDYVGSEVHAFVNSS